MDSDHPALRRHTVCEHSTASPTDAFSLLPVLYKDLAGIDQVQAAVDALAILNSIPDLCSIPEGTRLRYLENSRLLGDLAEHYVREPTNLDAVARQLYGELDSHQMSLVRESLRSLNSIADSGRVERGRLAYFP